MSDLRIDIVSEFTGRKAILDAEKSVWKLDKSVKALGRTLGVSLSAAAVVAYGKASVKAFAEDQRAATQLANTLDNLGLSFANTQIATFITDLSKAASISDNELRPAFQSLIQTTGSLAKSQELLNQAIDVSRATGVDLVQVSSDLAQAYVGNTRGLRKYNLGLTQAELKAASFAQIQDRLNSLFAGSSTKYLGTYAGKMQALSVAAGEAQETIGSGLIDAFAALSGGSTTEDAVKNINSMATALANIVKFGGQVGSVFKGLYDAFAFVGSLGGVLGANGLLARGGASKLNTNRSSSPAGSWARSQASKAAEAAAAKRAKELTASNKALTAEQKKQAALKKAGSIFDLQQIQIIAALKGNISEDEKKRLQLQLALETENVTEAQRLTLQIAKSQGLTTDLANTLASLPAASNPFAAWKGYLDAIELQAKSIASMTVAAAPTVAGNVTDASGFAGILPQGITDSAATARGGNITDASGFAGIIKVEIDGKEVASSLANQYNSGVDTFNNRVLGNFAI